MDEDKQFDQYQLACFSAVSADELHFVLNQTV